MDYCRTLVVQFDNELALWQVPLFRGAVISKVPKEFSLFHNHEANGLRYRYPLIQYKRINRKAAIVCVGEGTEAISDFFNQGNFQFNIGQRNVDMNIENVVAKKTIVQTWDSSFSYVLRKWLPLNSENYQAYKELDGLVEQCSFLQNILIGNILSFCKGMNIMLKNEVKCVITNIIDTKIYTYKGVKMTGFDVEFKSNVSLPDFIGLGKGVSLGFGMVNSKNESNK